MKKIIMSMILILALFSSLAFATVGASQKAAVAIVNDQQQQQDNPVSPQPAENNDMLLWLGLGVIGFIYLNQQNGG